MDSRPALALALALSCLALLGAPRSAHAQDSDVLIEEPDTALRLDAWLTLEADRIDGLRPWLGATAIGGGIAAAVLGGWGVADDDPALSSGLRTLSRLALALGVLDIALGVMTLIQPSGEEDRLSRFRQAQRRGLSPRDVAMFEGELRGAALSAGRARQAVRWVGVGLLAAGAVTLTLNAIVSPDDELGYWVGGITAGTGLLATLLSLVSSEIEDDWREYARGLRPARANELQVQVAPLVGPTTFGIGLSGTF